ncbi:MAG: DUF5050 domain-containing protein [Clostridia bacterium]|nr:DUF5050 domain-containing protein [Clostridia bacterium]
MLKRILALLFAAVLCISFAGCGEEAKPASSAESAAQPSSKTESSVPEPSSSAVPPKPTEQDESFPVINGPINGYFDNTFVSDGNEVYYLTKISGKNYEIRRLNPNGDDAVVSSLTGDIVDCLAFGEGKLFYYCLSGSNGLYSYDLASGAEAFVIETPGILHLWYVDGWLYYTTPQRTNGLRRCKPDGSGETVVSDTPDDYFFFYQDWVYATDGHGHSHRVNLETLEKEDVDDSKSFVKFLYKGKFVYNQGGKEFNTDGETLFVCTENGLFSTRSKDHPEDVLLYEKMDETSPGASIYHIHVCGDYLIFLTHDSSHEWHVVKKDGTYVKMLDKTDYKP